MKKQQVTILMDDNRQLYVRTKGGAEYEVNIFDGGGYITMLNLQTAEEREEIASTRRRQEQAWLEKHADAKPSKKWWQRWS